MSELRRMLLDDPRTARLLTEDMAEQLAEAGRNTVNTMAGKSRKEAIKNIKGEFITRNTYTERQVQYTPAEDNAGSIEDIQATVGINEKASYMARQEEGGWHTPRQGNTLAIPTDAARGGSKSNKVQLKVKDLLVKSHRVHGDPRPFKRKLKSGKTIRIKAKTYSSHKAWNTARGFVAYSKKLYLPWGGTGDQRNLHTVEGFKPEGRGFNRKVEFETTERYDFEYDKTKTAPQPWLFPACELTARDGQKIFNSNMKKLGI